MDNNSRVVYPWLDAYWEKLLRYQQQDRLPSAIMLVGEQGLGLSVLATAFAQRTVCHSTHTGGVACGTCEACLLFKAESYPDFFHIQPEEGKKSIKIDAIRELMASLALSSQYTKPRIVLIDPADAMLHQAANSLLKTLEEPSDNTCLILLADKLSNISATIRSRCQLIVVNDVDLVKATDWLEAQGCESAEQYLNLSNHLPILAFDLWKKEALLVRSGLFKDFILLVTGKLDPLSFAEKCIGLKELPALKWLSSWLTDAIKCANNSGSAKLMNADLKDDLKVLAEKLHLKEMYGLLDTLGRLMKLESSQVNQQLMLEEFAIQCYSLTVK